MSFVYNLNYNVTSLTDLSSNFLSLNDHEISFLWTSSKKLLSFFRFDTILVIVFFFLYISTIYNAEHNGRPW